MMTRGLIAATLVVATLEPVSGDVDLTKYAITQGGLLAVVLVLLFFYRRDFMRVQQRDDEKISILTDLVEKNTTALSGSSSQLAANEKATHRLARALENVGAVDRRSVDRG